ncbi:MAG: hypothetical protein U0325_01900 [Polyangiales bacterium]
MALLNNRALRATLRELGIPRGRLMQAGLVLQPSVMVDVRRSTDPSQPIQMDVEVERTSPARCSPGPRQRRQRRARRRAGARRG